MDNIDQAQSGLTVRNHDHGFITGKIRQRFEYIPFRVTVQALGGVIQN